MMHHAGYVFKDPCTGWNSFTASGTGIFAAISTEAAGIVGPFEGSKARQVLVQDEYSLEQVLNALK